MSEQKQLDEAARKYSADVFGEYDPEQQAEYDHFVAHLIKFGESLQSKQDGLLRWEYCHESMPMSLISNYPDFEKITTLINEKSKVGWELVQLLSDQRRIILKRLMPQGGNDERSVANVDAQSGAAGQTKTWQTDFTYFLEHLITNDKEKIKLIVAEVERIAGSKFSLDDMKYKQIAELISNIFFFGKFKSETENERKLERLLIDVGLWPTTEKEILGRTNV